MKSAILILLSLFGILLSCTHKKRNSKLINQEYDKAYDFNLLNISDSAYIYYGKALDVFEKNEDNFGQAKCLVAMAKILTEKGNYFKSQDFSFKANLLFNKEDTAQYYHISDNFNNLGMINNNLKKYHEAKDYYNSALKYSEDEISQITIIKNLATIYKEEKKYSQAIKAYDSILPIAKRINEKVYARLLSNLSNVTWLNDSGYDPEPVQLLALKIQQKIDDKMGQNASYAHLANYFKNKDTQKALLYAHTMYNVAKEVKSVDDEIEALQKITALDSKNYLTNFNQYISLRDSVQTARNIDNDKFAAIVYGVEETKTQNAKNKTQIQRQYFLLGILILLIIITTIEYRKRQKKLQQEKEIEVKNTQLKLSKKVHDVVANGIYQVMTKIENQEHFDKEEALDELEFVYEKSRDISYEKPDAKDTAEFNKKISGLVASFNNNIVKTYLAGNDQNIWYGVNDSTQNEIYQVIRELLVNMKKHSQASLVAFKFERKDDMIHIQYTDNGIGIQDEISYNNGLRNTVSRIEIIHGQIIFDTQTEKGLKIYISFPAP